MQRTEDSSNTRSLKVTAGMGVRQRLAAARLPLVSGKQSAALLFLCLLLTGVLIPVTAHLPRWIEFELVLLAWWLTWTLVLTGLLTSGNRVSDDASAPRPRSWGDSITEGVGHVGIDAAFLGAEGCLSSLFLVFLLVVLVIGLWAMVELLIPGLAFLLYLLIRGMLVRVVNDRHDCQNHPLKAFGWGTLWATLYTAPLAWIVWFIHVAVTGH